VRRILIKHILKVKPDVRSGYVLLNTKQIKCLCDEGECFGKCIYFIQHTNAS
jgi:hypothetical protein